MEPLDNVFVYDTPELLALAAAERVAGYEQAFHGRQERFSCVLAGGNTPRRVYELLATEAFKQRIEWDRIDLFFGDERCVPPDHPDSNYAMASQALLSQVPIPPQRIHRIPGEANPTASARIYERELRTYFGEALWPRFGLVFLGMGTDGHTASLFPGSPALNETEKWVVTSVAPQPPHERITLTIPVFNHAAQVLFLVSGAEKAKRIAQILKGHAETSPLPAQMIKPVAGPSQWLIDAAAASLL